MKLIKLSRLLLLSVMTIIVNVGCMSKSFDAGGIVVKNIKQPVENLVTGGQPTKDALKQLKDKGLTTVINLRTEGESTDYDEKAESDSLGLTYHSLPISGSSGISMENAKKLDEILSASDGPVLVHCASGNRAGALLALRAYLKESDAESAIEQGKAAGLTRLEKKVREVIAEEEAKK